MEKFSASRFVSNIIHGIHGILLQDLFQLVLGIIKIICCNIIKHLWICSVILQYECYNATKKNMLINEN